MTRMGGSGSQPGEETEMAKFGILLLRSNSYNQRPPLSARVSFWPYLKISYAFDSGSTVFFLAYRLSGGAPFCSSPQRPISRSAHGFVELRFSPRREYIELSGFIDI